MSSTFYVYAGPCIRFEAKSEDTWYRLRDAYYEADSKEHLFFAELEDAASGVLALPNRDVSGIERAWTFSRFNDAKPVVGIDQAAEEKLFGAWCIDKGVWQILHTLETPFRIVWAIVPYYM